MKPRFGEGLGACHKLLSQDSPPKKHLPIELTNSWDKVIPNEYGLKGWDDFKDYFFFRDDFSISVLLDHLTEVIFRGAEGRHESLLAVTEPFMGETFTTWRRLFTADVIQ